MRAPLYGEREREAGTGDKLKAVDVAYPINFSAPSISASPPVNFACVPHRDRTLDLLGEISGELLIYLPPSYYIILASRPSFSESRVGQVKNRIRIEEFSILCNFSTNSNGTFWIIRSNSNILGNNKKRRLLRFFLLSPPTFDPGRYSNGSNIVIVQLELWKLKEFEESMRSNEPV